MDDSRPFTNKTKRLTKQPPPTTFTTAGMNQNNYTHLQRQPSSSQSPVSSHHRDSHEQYQQQTPTSSNSSLERSPNPAGSQFAPATQPESYNNRQRYSARQSFDDPVPDPHPGVLSSLDSTKASGYQNSLRRPGPPPLSHTTPNATMMSPTMRHSSSFSIGDRSINTTPSDSDSSFSRSKRYSGDEANGGKNSASWKKKSGISSFIGSVLGSPRSNSAKISAPENPVHVTHVGYDNNTGQFTVRAVINVLATFRCRAHPCQFFLLCISVYGRETC